MKKVVLLSVGVFFSIVSCTKEEFFVPLSNVELAQKWLLTDCRVGEDSLTARLIATDSSLFKVFRSAFLLGPPGSMIDTIRLNEIARFNSRQVLVLDSVTNPELYNFIKYTDNKDSAADREAEKFIGRYRTRALQGLGMIKSYSAKNFLDSVIADPAQVEWHTTAQYIRLNPM
ncbi:MAG: hypothetical protein Q8916_15045 [Bacteroidota bacterium]|nr:hypothetical protein [Bacteroidota bacterium]MDP4231714.1 hypothetical protein [Bacteroidota bacterium]MDP4236832.1 hypothetical protein [Bacteroidota bacterium]